MLYEPTRLGIAGLDMAAGIWWRKGRARLAGDSLIGLRKSG